MSEGTVLINNCCVHCIQYSVWPYSFQNNFSTLWIYIVPSNFVKGGGVHNSPLHPHFRRKEGCTWPLGRPGYGPDIKIFQFVSRSNGIYRVSHETWQLVNSFLNVFFHNLLSCLIPKRIITICHGSHVIEKLISK